MQIPAKPFLLPAKQALGPQPLLTRPEPPAPDYPQDPLLNLLQFIITFPWFFPIFGDWGNFSLSLVTRDLPCPLFLKLQSP